MIFFTKSNFSSYIYNIYNIYEFCNKNFLFSSVGNNTNFDSLWINEDMNYDIYIIYYGDDDTIYNKYKSKVNFIEKEKVVNFKILNIFMILILISLIIMIGFLFWMI